MSYVLNERNKAKLRARRAAIIAAGIDLISKSGMEEFKLLSIAKSGGFASGLLYKEFPDMVEMKAAMFAHLLERDSAFIRAAAKNQPPLAALASALHVLFACWSNVRLAQAVVTSPIYLRGIRDEFERLIKAAMPDLGAKDREMAAAAAVGVLYGLHDIEGSPKTRASMAVLFALRGIGLSEAQARRAVAA